MPSQFGGGGDALSPFSPKAITTGGVLFLKGTERGGGVILYWRKVSSLRQRAITGETLLIVVYLRPPFWNMPGIETLQSLRRARPP